MNKKNLRRKLDEIELLEDNWNGYGANSFNDETIKRAHKVIDYLEDRWEDPAIVPSDIGIQFEWDTKGKSLEIYIDEEIDAIGFLKVVGDSIEDWEEGLFSDYDKINYFVNWLYE